MNPFCRIGEDRIAITDHVLNCYIERLRPGLDRDLAAREVAGLMQVGERVEAIPWARNHRGTTGYITVGDDYALVLVGRDSNQRAVTLLVRREEEQAPRTTHKSR